MDPRSSTPLRCAFVGVCLCKTAPPAGGRLLLLNHTIKPVEPAVCPNRLNLSKQQQHYSVNTTIHNINKILYGSCILTHTHTHTDVHIYRYICIHIYVLTCKIYMHMSVCLHIHINVKGLLYRLENLITFFDCHCSLHYLCVYRQYVQLLTI